MVNDTVSLTRSCADGFRYSNRCTGAETVRPWERSCGLRGKTIRETGLRTCSRGNNAHYFSKKRRSKRSLHGISKVSELRSEDKGSPRSHARAKVTILFACQHRIRPWYVHMFICVFVLSVQGQSVAHSQSQCERWVVLNTMSAQRCRFWVKIKRQKVAHSRFEIEYIVVLNKRKGADSDVVRLIVFSDSNSGTPDFRALARIGYSTR